MSHIVTLSHALFKGARLQWPTIMSHDYTHYGLSTTRRTGLNDRSNIPNQTLSKKVSPLDFEHIHWARHLRLNSIWVVITPEMDCNMSHWRPLNDLRWIWDILLSAWVGHLIVTFAKWWKNHFVDLFFTQKKSTKNGLPKIFTSQEITYKMKKSIWYMIYNI